MSRIVKCPNGHEAIQEEGKIAMYCGACDADNARAELERVKGERDEALEERSRPQERVFGRGEIKIAGVKQVDRTGIILRTADTPRPPNTTLEDWHEGDPCDFKPRDIFFWFEGDPLGGASALIAELLLMLHRMGLEMPNPQLDEAQALAADRLEEITALKGRAGELVSFIKEREWSFQGHCPEPECYRTKKDGHADNCPRQAILGKG